MIKVSVVVHKCPLSANLNICFYVFTVLNLCVNRKYYSLNTEIKYLLVSEITFYSFQFTTGVRLFCYINKKKCNRKVTTRVNIKSKNNIGLRNCKGLSG
jgi:hypothetical protein